MRRIPVQERSKFTVDVIIEGAIRIFNRDGLAVATTIKIAEKAGVSVGSLYEYFPNKEAIFLRVVEMKIEECTIRVIDNLDQVGKKLRSFRAVIRHLVWTYSEIYAENEWLYRQFRGVALDIRSVLAMIEKSDENVAVQTARLLQKTTRKATYPEEDLARMAVRCVHASVRGMALLHTPESVLIAHSAMLLGLFGCREEGTAGILLGSGVEL